MPKTHVCEKCGIKFSQKGHLTDHLQKKNDCAKKTDLIRIIEEKVEEKVEEKLKAVRVAVQPHKEVTIENLPSFFEDLHNLLWNKVGLNPENALKHMNLFFAYRMLDLQKDKLNLPDECRWSKLIELPSAEMLDQAIKKGIVEFRRSYDIVKPFFFQHEVKKVQIIHDIVHLINGITLDTLQQTDTLGDIFEYMIGRGMSTMADEGQYFTNRTICKLAFKLAFDIKKELRRPDGTLCTFADWFCGTGGFTIEYIKGVTKNLVDIDWKKDKLSIYSQDQNDSSVTTTLLNTLITTGEPFLPKTIRMGNSFADPITRGNIAPFPGLVIDYCFMNPPYGGDKSKGKDYKFAYAKGKGNEKQYLVNQDIQSIGIEDDDKVSAGVQLAMATLSSDGGVCCIVLPQGFFFGASKKCIELRKRITEEYRIHSVVDIASGSFLNTGTKTSMMVFQKGVGATDTVTFMGLDETVLVEATLEELRAKNYSLNYKQYLPQSAVEVDGFEIKKLSDIASDITFGFMVSSNDYGSDGVPVIKTKNIKHKSVEYPAKDQKIRTVLDDRYKVNKGDLLIVLGGSPGENGIWNHTEYAWLNQDCANIKIDNEITKKYVFYMLESDPVQMYITSNITKTTIGHISRGVVRDIQIPLPSLEKQQEIVDSIDGFTQLAHAEEQSLKLLEKSVMFEVKWMGMGKERVKLGDVCEIHHGKRVTKKEHLGTIYPVYGGGDDTFRTDNKNREGFTCKVSRFGISEHNCVQTINGDYWLMDSGFTVKGLSEKTIDVYLYYWLLQHKERVYQCGRATAQMNMDMDTFRDLEIPLPSLAEQQTLQSDFDEICHKHAKIAEYKAKAQAAIQRLIPGAKAPTAQSPDAHSSSCKHNEDGTGCTCSTSRSQIVDEEEDEKDEKSKHLAPEVEEAAQAAGGSRDLTETELSKKYLPELKEIAKNLAVKLYSKMNRGELIQSILKKQAGK